MSNDTAQKKTAPVPVKPVASVPEKNDPAVAAAVLAAAAEPGKTFDLPNGLTIQTF